MKTKAQFLNKRNRKSQLIAGGLVFAAVAGFAVYGISYSRTSFAAEKPHEVAATIEGTVRVYHGDNIEGRTSFTRSFIESRDGKKIELKGKHHDKVEAAAGQQVTVSGQLALSTNTLAVQSVAAAAATPLPPTSFNIAVMMINFKNDTRKPVTVASIQNTVFGSSTSTKQFYAENSYGKFSLTGKTFGYYTIDFDAANRCNTAAWTPLADAAAKAAGVNLAAYNQLSYVFPDAVNCGWGGLSDTVSRTWFNAGTGTNYPYVFAHEYAHNMGLQHATDWNCQSATGVAVPLNAPSLCAPQYEYGDPYNPMGTGYYHFDAFQKERMGWLTADRIKTLTTDGTTTIQPIETKLSNSTAGFLAAKVRLDARMTLYMEARKPVGFDARVNSIPVKMSGVKVTIVDNYDIDDPFMPTYATNYTHIIDSTPGSNPTSADFDFHDAVLLPGKSITDPATGIVIKVGTKTSSGGFPVTVTMPKDLVKPTTPQNPQATPDTAASVRLNWSAATDNKAVTGYRIYRSAGSAPASLFTTVAGTAVTYTDTTAANNTVTRYAYQIAAIDAAGNESNKSPTVGTGDVTPPVMAADVFGYNTSDSTFMFKWDPDTDAVGYRMLQSKNGGTPQLVVDTTGARDPYGNLQYEFTGLTPGRYTFWIIPRDAAGNETAPRPFGNMSAIL